MPRAILIAGAEWDSTFDKERFLTPLLEFGMLLKNSSFASVLWLDAGNFFDLGSFMDEVSDLAAIPAGYKPSPLLIAYHGHGGLEGWHIRHHLTIPYNIIVSIVARHCGDARPILVINDCYGVSPLIAFLEREGVPPDCVGVIEASYEEKGERGAVIKSIGECWARGIAFPAPAFPVVREDIIMMSDLGYGEESQTMKQCRVCVDGQMHLFPIRELPHTTIVDSVGGSRRRLTYVELVSKRWGRSLDGIFCGNNKFYLSP
jgi:hypothetical protein